MFPSDVELMCDAMSVNNEHTMMHRLWESKAMAPEIAMGMVTTLGFVYI
jgi:hypothetical protein